MLLSERSNFVHQVRQSRFVVLIQPLKFTYVGTEIINLVVGGR